MESISLSKIVWPGIWISLFLMIGCPKKNEVQEPVPRTFEELDAFDEIDIEEDTGTVEVVEC